MVELRADADKRPSWVERLADDLKQRRPLLEHLQQAVVPLELLTAQILEQARRAADVQALPFGCESLTEQGPNRTEKRVFARAEARILEPSPEHVAAELEAGNPFVQVLPGPVRETRIDRLVEAREALGDAAGRGD